MMELSGRIAWVPAMATVTTRPGETHFASGTCSAAAFSALVTDDGAPVRVVLKEGALLGGGASGSVRTVDCSAWRGRADASVRAETHAQDERNVHPRARVLRAEHHEGAGSFLVHAAARQFSGRTLLVFSLRSRGRVRFDGRARGGGDGEAVQKPSENVRPQNQDVAGDAGEDGDVLRRGDRLRVGVPPREEHRLSRFEAGERAAREGRLRQARRLRLREEAGQGIAHVHLLRYPGVRRSWRLCSREDTARPWTGGVWACSCMCCSRVSSRSARL